MSTSNGQPSAAVIDALKRGNKVEAIKLQRAETGMGLKDSKEFVEAYLYGNAEVSSAYLLNRRKASGGSLVWIGIVIATAILVYVFFGDRPN